MSSSLAIVEKKPPFANGGGCAGGVLFHLLDWHRRLARKRRLFSPRRLLPSSIRSSSPRRLPSPQSPAPPPRPASQRAAGADGAAAPGVVARLMGLESWPAAAGAAAAPRLQKQRKVEVASVGDNESAVVVVLPPTRRPPAPAPAHAHAPRSHHSSDLPARSPRRTRLVHAAAAKLLEPGARGSLRASAKLALAYACSSPQHRRDASHSGASQSWGMLDDFLSRSDSLSLECSTLAAAVPAPVLPADTERDNAISSRWHEKNSINTMSSTAAVDVVRSDTVVVPRMDFDDANTSRGSSDVDAMRIDRRVRAEGMGSCARIRSSCAGAGARTGEERLMSKRGTPSRQDACRSVGSGNLVSSTRPIRSASELVSGSRRAAHNYSSPRRELMGSITPQRSARREVTDRSGLASTSRNTSNASGLKRGSRKKIDRGTAASSRQDCNTVALASSSSVRSVSRASSRSKVSEKRGFRSTQSDTTCTRMLVVDAKCLETSPSVVATSEKQEFSRLLKAKINELGLSDRVELEPSDAHSGNLTVSVLQELISALTNDTNTSASQSGNYSDSSAPVNNAENAFNSNDQSPDFQKCYQFQGDQEADSSATCMSNEPNQPSPTSVLEACFSNTSSLGSPTENIEGKEFFVSIENKMEDLFNLESDIVDLAMSIDTTKTHALGSGEISCVQNFAVRDFKFLEARLHSIGEAISNAELLLDSSLLCNTPSSLSLHSFIIEMLESIEGLCLCGGSENLGHTEEKKYQRTNFLFDCIVESLNSKFGNFGKCGYKAWLRLPLTLSKDILKKEISEEISSWRESSEICSSLAAEKELDQVTARWDACQVEAFDVSIAIENDIIEALVDEFAFDQW